MDWNLHSGIGLWQSDTGKWRVNLRLATCFWCNMLIRVHVSNTICTCMCTSMVLTKSCLESLIIVLNYNY